MIDMIKTHWPSLVAFAALMVVTQLVGAAVTFPNIPTWYRHLQRPDWSPPNWLFGPVWTILYIIMALVGWQIWHSFTGSFADRIRQPALVFFFIQLFCNFIWSPLFFGYHFLWLAFADLLLILLFTAFTIYKTMAFSSALGYWLVPYMLWLAYATCLNFAIALKN